MASTTGITFSGLSSGIDTDSIISKLVQLEQAPITRLRTQQLQLTQKKSLYDGLKGRLNSLSGAAVALNQANSMNAVTGTSSNTATATISASSTASAGTYQLAVSKLAQTHKISSTAQQNTSDPLGLSGKLVINGKGVTIESTDSLQSIASKINSSGSVIASIIDGGEGQAYLSLTSKNSGAANKIQIADLDGNVAEALGLATGSLDFRETLSNGGVTSAGFSSSTTAIGSVLAQTGLGTQTFTLNGQAINVDLDSSSLQDIAAAINTSGAGVTATVRSVTQNGQTVHKLDLTGITSYDDSDGVLQGLGILQKGYGNQLVAAQDAEYTLDGVSLKSATNEVTGVIAGVTFTLLKANETTPETTTITLNRDNQAIKDKVKGFVDAYNNVIDFIRANSAFDKDTFESGPLFGDSVVQQIESQLGSTFFSSVSGLSGNITSLAQIGLSYDDNGKIEIDDAKLSEVISNDTTALGNVFRAMGTASTSALSYITSSSKTKPSGATGYQIYITQPALQHALEAEFEQTGPLASPETLTFSGKLFNDKEYTLILESGLTQTQIMDKINADSKLKDLVTATIVNGKLQVTSKKYGTAAEFNISSDKASDPNQSGLGTPTILSQGTNVEGTINGEPATGNGQVLVGNSGNANTDGLQVMVTSNTTGVVGNIVFTKGIAPLISDLVTTFTDATNGIVSINAKSFDTQSEDIEKSITSLTERITAYQESLRLKFARMEQAMAALQSQGNQIAAALASFSTSNK